MKNKLGILLASLSAIGLFISLLGESSPYAKAGLVIFFFFLICIGILLESPIGSYFKERFEEP